MQQLCIWKRNHYANISRIFSTYSYFFLAEANKQKRNKEDISAMETLS